MRLINLNTTRLRPDQYVYIGRPSKWGNPYSHLPSTIARFKVLNRALAIQAYEPWLRSSPQLMAALPELVDGDKPLACYCAPLACHGDILMRLLYELGYAT
jgi:hypothetical protein